MSSSKIQSRNLDPNMDLAKESSVQRVLSAVKPTGYIGDYQLLLQDKSTENSSKDWVNKEMARIDGKGIMLWAEIVNYMSYNTTSFPENDYSEITLYVDGVVHSKYRYTTIGDTYQINAFMIVCDSKYLIGDASGRYYTPSAINHASGDIVCRGCNNTMMEYRQRSNNSFGAYRGVHGYVTFEESLVVTVSSVGSPTSNWTKTFSCAIAYILDEE